MIKIWKSRGIAGLIKQVQFEDIRSQLVEGYNDVIKTLDKHVDSTDALIQALKKALEE